MTDRYYLFSIDNYDHSLNLLLYYPRLCWHNFCECLLSFLVEANLCVGFFLFVCLRAGITIVDLTLSHFCVCQKLGPRFTLSPVNVVCHQRHLLLPLLWCPSYYQLCTVCIEGNFCNWFVNKFYFLSNWFVNKFNFISN